MGGFTKSGAGSIVNEPTNIKEPFLLAFAILWIGSDLAKTLYRRRSGEPFENQTLGASTLRGNRIALLVLWYSLPRSEPSNLP
jgi:hypothetical protein